MHMPGVLAEGEETKGFRIVFTGDLSGATDGYEVYDANTDTYQNAGGFARLSSLIKENKRADTLVMDAGGHSSASSLDGSTAEIMSTMGYDIIALGNEDIPYAQQEASFNGTSLLQTVLPDVGDKTVVKEVNGVKVGVFGLMGSMAAGSLPSEYACNVGPELAADRVAELQAQGAEYIVCLYHGNMPAKNRLMSRVGIKGIDLIICSDGDVELHEPVKAGDTYIVSVGGYARSLGMLEIDATNKKIKKLDIISNDRDVPEDPTTAQAVNKFRADHDDRVKKALLSPDQVLGYVDQDLGDPHDPTLRQAQSGTETLLADAYANAWHMQKDTGRGTAISLIPRNTMIGELMKGKITLQDLGDVGVSGRKLVRAYIKGDDLLKLCEIDRSYGYDDPYYAFSFGNMIYKYLDQRSMYNRISEVRVQETLGYWANITAGNYYPVVMTDDVPQRLAAAEKASSGVLHVDLYDAVGQVLPIDELPVMIDRNGEEITEKSALETYIRSFNRNDAGLHDISDQYRKTKNVRRTDVLSWRSWFRNTTDFAKNRYKRLAVLVFGVMLLLYVVRAVYRFIRRDHIRELY